MVKIKVETGGAQGPIGGPGDQAPTMAQRIKADANRIEYEIDVTGRRIGVRKLSFLDLHEITVAVGENAQNAAAFNQILAVASVCEIGSDPVPTPTSHLEVKVLMKRLGFHGLDAAIKAVARYGKSGEDIDSIKNS